MRISLSSSVWFALLVITGVAVLGAAALGPPNRPPSLYVRATLDEAVNFRPLLLTIGADGAPVPTARGEIETELEQMSLWFRRLTGASLCIWFARAAADLTASGAEVSVELVYPSAISDPFGVRGVCSTARLPSSYRAIVSPIVPRDGREYYYVVFAPAAFRAGRGPMVLDFDWLRIGTVGIRAPTS